MTPLTDLRSSRRWFRVGVCVVALVLCLDVLLTVRVYGPRARSAPLRVGNTGSNVHTGYEKDNSNPVFLEHGGGYGGSSTTQNKSLGGGGGQKQKEKEKLYIASIHWNDAEILAAHWIPALLNLVTEYGAANLYISILESGSWDETKTLLRSLDSELEKLGVERRIVLEDRTHEDELTRIPDEAETGWIWGTRGRREMRRIPYLAAARNRAMEPLRELRQRGGEGKRVFDRVVWLNDVIFTVCLSPLHLHCCDHIY